MEDAVKLTHVSKSFDGFSLDRLSFSIKKGFITGFIGPNGAGKTTTIKLIMNLIKARFRFYRRIRDGQRKARKRDQGTHWLRLCRQPFLRSLEC